MNVHRVALLLVAMNLFAAVVLGQPSGKLAGTVSDINKARVHGATVVVTIEGVARTTTTNEEGAYELDLPSGIYRITVESIGFCPSRRASFRIKPSTAVTLNFTLLPCPISNDLKIVEGQYKGEVDRYRDPFNEEVFLIKQVRGMPLELMVRYAARRRVGKFLEYSGTVVTYDVHAETPAGYRRSEKSVGVTATYDSIRIRAERLLFDPQALRLEAIGNVVLEDGEGETEGTTIEVRFSNGKAIIERVK